MFDQNAPLDPAEFGPVSGSRKLLLLLGFPLGGLTLLLAIGLAATLLTEKKSASSTALAQAVLPDGTTLVVEAVTFGKTHEFTFKDPPREWWWMGASSHRRLSHHTSSDQLCVWLSNRSSIDHRCLDVDWYGSALVIDRFGTELPDDQPRREAYGAGGMSSSSGRPLPPLGNPRLTYIALSTTFPAFRPNTDGSFVMRVTNVAGKQVAEFKLQYPGPHAEPGWKPESLPASRNLGQLTAILTKIDTYSSVTVRDGNTTHGMGHYPSKAAARKAANAGPTAEVYQRVSISPHFELLWDGKPADDWYVSGHSVSDELNRQSQWMLGPDIHEPAWKISASFHRKASAKFDPKDIFSLTDIELPAANNGRQRIGSGTAHGTKVDLLAIGNGNVDYGSLMSKASGGWHHSGGNSNNRFEIKLDNHSGKTSQLRVDSSTIHLLVRVDTLPNPGRLDVRIHNQNGKLLEVDYPATIHDVQFFFLKPNQELTDALDIEFIVQEGQRAEYFISPPQVAPLKENDAPVQAEPAGADSAKK